MVSAFPALVVLAVPSSVDVAVGVTLVQVEQAPDGHFKFHAACVVNICIQQVGGWVLAGWLGDKTSACGILVCHDPV